jgi:allantoicase
MGACSDLLCAQVKDDARYTHIRLNMFPDGGIARLRVYGEVVPNWGRVPVSVFV